MNYFDLNDYDSESDDNNEALDEETLEEMDFHSKLASISMFKKLIDKEPEFYGINNLSNVTIYDIVKKEGISKKNSLSAHQEELFEDLYYTLDMTGNSSNFNFVFEKITEIIQV